LNELRDELVTKREFTEKMDFVINMLQKSAKEQEIHDTEHVANMAMHDRFEARITRTEKALKN